MGAGWRRREEELRQHYLMNYNYYVFDKRRESLIPGQTGRVKGRGVYSYK